MRIVRVILEYDDGLGRKDMVEKTSLVQEDDPINAMVCRLVASALRSFSGNRNIQVGWNGNAKEDGHE